MTEEDKKDSGYYFGPAALSPIPLTVSSPIIKATDKGKIRSNALESMKKHAEQQMSLLRKQAQLIMDQVKQIEERIRISEEIYLADMSFEPVVGHTYHLYSKGSGKKFLSIVAPHEWGRSKPDGLAYIATVTLLPDKSWEFNPMSDKPTTI